MSKNGRPDFWDWIGINTKPDYATAPKFVGHVIGFLFSAAVLLLVTIGFGVFGWLVKSIFLPIGTNPAEDIRNYGLATGAVFGVPFLIWRSFVAQKQVDVTEQGHITDRINKAVEGLGAEKTVKRDGVDQTEPNLEVRIGALYALERISQDSDRDHVNVMEILCAYIRNNADRHSPALPDEEPEEGWRAWGEANRTHLPLDVDVALKIIERRDDSRKAIEEAYDNGNGYRLGLERAPFHALDLGQRDLTDAILTNAQLQGAYLSFAELQGAYLWLAKLQGADLWGAELQGAYLVQAELQGADLGSAELQGAHLVGVKLQWADLGSAKLQGAHLQGAKLQGANLWNAKLDKSTATQAANFSAASCVGVNFTNSTITIEQLGTMFGDATTLLPGGHGPDHPDWPARWPKEKLDGSDFQTAWHEWQAKIGFQPPKNPQ